jgi:transposase-like protein
MFNKCPQCGKPAIPLSKKLSLKNKDIFTCQACGAQLKYPKWIRLYMILSYITVFLFYDYYMAPMPLNEIIKFSTLLIIGLLITGISYLVFPFEKK